MVKKKQKFKRRIPTKEEEALLVIGDLLLEKGLIEIRKTPDRITTATIETIYSPFPESEGGFILDRGIYPEDDKNVIERKLISLVAQTLEEARDSDPYFYGKKMPETARAIARKYLNKEIIEKSRIKGADYYTWDGTALARGEDE